MKNMSIYDLLELYKMKSHLYEIACHKYAKMNTTATHVFKLRQEQQCENLYAETIIISLENTERMVSNARK